MRKCSPTVVMPSVVDLVMNVLVKEADDMIGRPLLLMSGHISGCENRRVTVQAPEVASHSNASCASFIVVTMVEPTQISQAPLMQVHHLGIFAAGVLGEMLPRKRRSPAVVRLDPTVRCML